MIVELKFTPGIQNAKYRGVKEVWVRVGKDVDITILDGILTVKEKKLVKNK